MESDNLNNGENPSASTSTVQEHDDFSFSNRNNDAADSLGIFHNGSSAIVDPLSFRYTPYGIAPFRGKHMCGTYQPYTHSIPETRGSLMIDLNQLHNKQNPQTDPNSINTSTSIPSLNRQGIPFHEENVKLALSTQDKIGAADAYMNDLPHSNSCQNSGINSNFSLIRGSARGYEMTRMGGEADGSNIHGPQIKNFFGLGGSRMYNPQNIGQINIDDHEHDAQISCKENIDGSFLSLGIRGKTDAETNSLLTSREISCELEGAVSPQLNTSHVQHAIGNSLNPVQNLSGGVSSFQNNLRGFTNPGHNAGGWASINNNVGVVGGSTTGLVSSPSHILQKPQPDVQRSFPYSSNKNLGLVVNRNSRNVNIDPYKGYIGQLATSSGPFSRSSARLHYSGQHGAPQLASESGNFTTTTTQPTSDQLQQRFMETLQTFSPESSMVSPFTGFTGSFSRQEHSGQFFPASKDSATQAFGGSAQLPRRKRVQPAGQLFSANDVNVPVAAGAHLLPKRSGVQVTPDSAAQAARSGPFPKRLGIQVNAQTATQAAGYGLFRKGTGIQVTEGNVPCAADHGLYPKEMAIKTPSSFQEGLPLQFSKDLLGPTSTSCQSISTAKGYGLSQPSNATVGPSKRSIIPAPQPAPRVQRRKIAALQPPIPPSMPSPPQSAPSRAIPAPVPHIKWQGPDELPQPSGEKCMLCKRDLSFTPEGDMYQPAVPPPVAVLPCRHTFHDHCLELITPKDQSKDPPCIPCAIGET